MTNKTHDQVVRKLKKLGRIYSEYQWDMESNKRNKKVYQEIDYMAICVRKQMETITWATNIGYRKYLIQ